jgi:hypothetical protein
MAVTVIYEYMNVESIADAYTLRTWGRIIEKLAKEMN